LVEPETAGDPQSEQKWVRSSLRQLSRRLDQAGHRASPPTVSRLLRDRKYSLRVNSKQEAGKDHPDRGAQFQYLEAQKQAFLAAGQPVISVDTKKKELVGNFANRGKAWGPGAERVNDPDFRQDALGRAAPYGIYDLRHNRGSVYVGESADTPRFAVDAIVAWWHHEGQAAYPQATELLVLADSGGSNGCQPRAWKGQLQEQLADRVGLTITVCHYPTGCSKWNPVERRLFGPISINWAGQPLRSFQRILRLIRGTTTQTGLTVRAERLPGEYPKGETLTDAEMERLHLERHATCPRWNYTIRPRLAAAT
jgi:DDE family transposase